MCGRYALYGPTSRLREHFEVDFDAIDFRPSYNLAPMQFAPVVVQREGERQVARLRWGFLPSWARDSSMAAQLFNARSETAAEKPSFRAAFRSRRCLVPADGFYEWSKAPGGAKQPYFVHLDSGAPMALAGLWEHWTSPEGESVSTFIILTTDANDRIGPLHDRMPVILPPETWALWLNPARTPAQVIPLMLPFPSRPIAMHAVSPRVGNARLNDPSLIDPFEAPGAS